MTPSWTCQCLTITMTGGLTTIPAMTVNAMTMTVNTTIVMPTIVTGMILPMVFYYDNFIYGFI